MLKLTKKADYAMIALRHLTTLPGSASAQPDSASAKDIADCYGIPLPLLSKVLRTLVHQGLLTSEQGANGGYKLARDARDISALEVIRAIDGPIILTHCFTEHAGHVECDQTTLCPVREPLRKVHEGIMRLLAGISIADLSQDEMQVPVVDMVSGIQPSRMGTS